MDDTWTINPVRGAEAAASRGPALALVWSLEEPHRVGERIVLADRSPVVIGRGERQADDPAPRAAPVRMRPGRNETQGAFASRTLSKVQAIVERRGTQVRVSNVGRAALRIGSSDVTEGTLGVGELLTIEGRMAWLCIDSPSIFPELPDVPLHRFGEADALGLVGESEAMWALRGQLAFVGARRAHVLIGGPSGSGKELAARAMHTLSGRRRGPWVDRNAATMPEGLVDAELFGHARNYPNPGTPERTGLIGEADGGTLFLDELGELPESVQAHLLRVLDEGRYQRLGESRTRTADLRLVAATNRPLSALKHDLGARFKLRVEVPGLEARREDVPLLQQHLLRRILDEDSGLRDRFGTERPRFGLHFTTAALQHPWTTHARELDAWIWRGLAECHEGWIELATTPAPGASEPDVPEGWQGWVGADPASIPAGAVQACLEAHNGSQELTWQALGLNSRHVLRRLIARHHIAVTKQR
ncbi:MAG: sigma 54-interacting transcriptional regulator [Myxococcota bacterium]